MNHRQMLDKIAELEARIDLLERGQSKQTQFSPVPQFTYAPHIGLNPSWVITCKDEQGKEFH
jgi:hypothetical protein